MLASILLIGCALADPGAPYFEVGGAPIGDGKVLLRVASCLPVTLDEVTVTVYREGPDAARDEPALWHVVADADDGPSVAAGGAVDVVIGDPPEGMVERAPLENPLPGDEQIKVEVLLSGQAFGYFFRPREVELGSFLIEEDHRIDVEDFDDDIDDLCR